MARPKSIQPEKRLTVFLSYRRCGGKINPVAKDFGFSRATVRAIVKEFLKMGFSERPRAAVSTALLVEMQEQHLAILVQLPGMGVGPLNLELSTDNDNKNPQSKSEILPVSEESLWHLRGTAAEQVIQETRTAFRDFLDSETEAWRSLSHTLEEECQLLEGHSNNANDAKPRLLPALKQRLHDAFLNEEFLVNPPPQSWLQWDLDPGDSRTLRLNGRPVGTGVPEDHQKIRVGVSAFLRDNFQEHQKRFYELERLRRDMILLGGIVEKTLGAITEEEIRRGVCPACPYPELLLDL